LGLSAGGAREGGVGEGGGADGGLSGSEDPPNSFFKKLTDVPSFYVLALCYIRSALSPGSAPPGIIDFPHFVYPEDPSWSYNLNAGDTEAARVAIVTG
jgi:hypothetical protein